MNKPDIRNKPEVIDLDAIWYGGGFRFVLEKDNVGHVLDQQAEFIPNEKISDDKILNFWKEIYKLGVWKWHKKYPYWKQKYQPLTDQCSWELKLRNRDGKSKYCHGYASFPRNFKKLIEALNELFGAEVEWS